MSLTADIIAEAQRFEHIRAAMVSLKDVLEGKSYRAAADAAAGAIAADAHAASSGPTDGSLLVLGLKHPAADPRLDWWESGDSWGNRQLRQISEQLRQWLIDSHGLTAHPLPYHLEKGGVFLKDAAVLSGLGIIGHSNLLLHPDWGPSIRLRSVLIEADLPPTGALNESSPCDSCEQFCQKACPVEAFPDGRYSREICYQQMHADEARKTADGDIDASGKPAWVIRYCRACELSCPVGQ